MKRTLVTFYFLLILIISCTSQNYLKTNLGAKTTVNSIVIDVMFYSPSVVRVVKYPENDSLSKSSLSVIKTPEKTKLNISQNDKFLTLKTKILNVNIDLSTGKVMFSDIRNTNLLKEKDNGVSFTNFNDAGNKTYTVFQAFTLENDEAIYGLGQQQQGKMNQRGVKLKMIQDNLDDYIPFFVSNKGYGMFWDNYSPTFFEDTPATTSFKSDVGDCVDYYFMYGENADGVISKMRDLTGQAPMFPLWTFGYWQSKERYKSQTEVVDVVKKYRDLQVPLDGIIQDWQYWGNNYLWNAMDFLTPEFNQPQKMVNDIHSLNAHIIPSIWASFGPHTLQYKELKEKGMLLNFVTWPMSGTDRWPPNMDYPSGVLVYDVYNPEARDIYWKYLNKGIFSLGVDGWWMDSTEPDHHHFKDSDFDNQTFLGSFRKVRNAFPLMTVGGVYQHQREISSQKRVFILTRSAFAGQQRYGANTWSGDTNASWETLKNQISAGLNFSLSAIPYWNSDIGGFFLNNYKKKINDAEYTELYTRWLQFGTFTPMMRSHGTDAPREIYQFGKKGDKVYDAIEKFIRLRYSLLPYIYSTSWDVTKNQSTMMRALVMDFAKDNKTLDINDEYMFGKSILVSPVTQSMYSNDTKEDINGVKSKKLYLPNGTEWFDFWTSEKISGGQYIEKNSPLDIIPLYVKAGSIIPFGPDVQYAEEKKWDNLEIRVYDGADGTFILYEDENDNYNYENGEYSTIKFSWNNKTKTLTIDNRLGNFIGMLNERKFTIVNVSKLNGNTEKHNEIINYNGKKVTVKL